MASNCVAHYRDQNVIFLVDFYSLDSPCYSRKIYNWFKKWFISDSPLKTTTDLLTRLTISKSKANTPIAMTVWSRTHRFISKGWIIHLVGARGSCSSSRSRPCGRRPSLPAQEMAERGIDRAGWRRWWLHIVNAHLHVRLFSAEFNLGSRRNKVLIMNAKCQIWNCFIYFAFIKVSLTEISQHIR